MGSFVLPGVGWVRRHPRLFWGGLTLGGVLIVAYVSRKKLLSASRVLSSTLSRSLFVSVIPARSARYTDEILQVAKEEGVSPFLLVALMERESRSGDALSPKGPGGTGDGGHGRGLMQIDDRSFGPWLAANDWRNPYVNIKKGAQVLKGKMTYLRGRFPDLSDAQLIEASIAAYNAGENRVAQLIQAGQSVDARTTGKNYSTDVLSRVAALETAFNNLLA